MQQVPYDEFNVHTVNFTFVQNASETGFSGVELRFLS